MATNTIRTSKTVASKASKQLKTGATKSQKSVAASALTNRKPKT